MDTNLGVIQLSENQKKNFPFLAKPIPFKGFSIWEDGKIVGVSDEEPTQEQITQTVSWFQNLPNELCEDYLLEAFDPELAIDREAQVFNIGELMRFMAVSYTINELIRHKNFWGGVANGNPYMGLKQVGLGLVQSGAILQSDYDKLNSILMEQGIDLNAH